MEPEVKKIAYLSLFTNLVLAGALWYKFRSDYKVKRERKVRRDKRRTSSMK